MDKRSLIALALIAIIIVAPMLLMPRTEERPAAADSTATPVAPALDTSRDSVDAPRSSPALKTGSRTSPGASASPVASAPAETVSVATPDRVARFVAPGAALVSVGLPDYRDLRRR